MKKKKRGHAVNPKAPAYPKRSKQATEAPMMKIGKADFMTVSPEARRVQTMGVNHKQKKILEHSEGCKTSRMKKHK